MIENTVKNSGEKLEKATLFLKGSLKENSKIERGLEKRSLALKKKIVEDRGRTLKRLASGGRDKGTGGVLGSALNILGVSAGAGGINVLTRGLRRTPNTPSQLLKMQRGTSVSRLSRIGRVGRLAKPLAVVGAGLDFVGRKAEGQTNTQAGVGAAGGFAGGLAGAKIGASIGTLAGPVGTIIGGAGGAIIGSLAGGRIGDLFTGANRRRQFEEERVQIRTSETLFSESLDDFDSVLDKLEKLSPNLTLKSLTDDEKLRKFALDDFTPPPPPPPTKKPNQDPKDIKVPEDVGITVDAFMTFLAIAGISIAFFLTMEPSEQLLVFIAFLRTQAKKVFSRKAAEVLLKRILPNLVKKKKNVETPISKVEVITDKTLNKVLDSMVEGIKRGKPISEEGLQKLSMSRLERLELLTRNLNIVKKFNLKRYKTFLDALGLAEDQLSFDDFVKMSKRELDKFSGKIKVDQATEDINKDLELVERFAKGDRLSEILGEGATIKDIKNAVKAARDAIKEGKQLGSLSRGQKASLDIIDQILEERIKVLDKRQQLKGVQIGSESPLESVNLEKLFRESKEGATFRKLMDALKLLREGTPLSSLEPPSSSNIASLPSKDIFFLGQNGNNLSPVNNIGGKNTIAMIRSDNPLRQLMLERQVNQLITT